MKRINRLFKFIGPGLLVAATGVGAGDLATASFTGSRLGTTILWAVVIGGVMKFVINEGLARWQLATGQTFLEGVATKFGKPVGWIFLFYLILWSFFVGSALMSACGATMYAIFPYFNTASQGKLVFGVLSSLIGLSLVLAGGYHLFEKVMRICIFLMFVTVVVTVYLIWPGTSKVLSGILIPHIPKISESISWTMALIGGIGGSVTLLCYGYWITETGIKGKDYLTICRFDLAVGYLMTVVFGIGMVIIGSTIDIEGSGEKLLVTLGERLQEPLGSIGKWIFLVGALGTVFSSLLGVWQAVPYLFADIWRLFFQEEVGEKINTHGLPYRVYLFGIALVPMLGLFGSFQKIQKIYSMIGAAFMPILALALLSMNNRRSWVGELKNRRMTQVALLGTLVFFLWLALHKWIESAFSLFST